VNAYRARRSHYEKLNKTSFKLIRALDETNTSFELNLQWPLKALTMTISNMVVMDALHNVIEVREEVDPFNTTLRLLLYLLMQHNNSPQ
jgi:hypothetical protein